MGTHDHHIRVRWDQFEAAYRKHGPNVLSGHESVFLEDVPRERPRFDKSATLQLSFYCRFIRDRATENQLLLIKWVDAFSPYGRNEENPPPRAAYMNPDCDALAFSPEETRAIREFAGAISITKVLVDYEAFLESDPEASPVKGLIWMERYLATILALWDRWSDGNDGMVYARF